MIHDLRVNSHGYPSFFEGPEEENIRKWDRILGRMEFLFREANEDTCRKKNLYEEEHDLAQEEFTTKYGMFGEKLKTKEAEASEDSESDSETAGSDDAKVESTGTATVVERDVNYEAAETALTVLPESVPLYTGEYEGYGIRTYAGFTQTMDGAGETYVSSRQL